MNPLAEDIARTVMMGVGATAVMDVWLLFLKTLHIPTLNFGYLGRWVGHGIRGRWVHDAIGRASPVRGEVALGWAFHYAAGVAFAGLLVAFCGFAWVKSPTYLPALVVGIGTVLVPVLVMQPAMGAGIASRRTATPFKNNLRSLANHAVFGTGLYLAAFFIQWISR